MHEHEVNEHKVLCIRHRRLRNVYIDHIRGELLGRIARLGYKRPLGEVLPVLGIWLLLEI